METFVLKKDKLHKLLNKILVTHQIFSPIDKSGEILFEQIKDPSKINLDYFNSKIPPKDLLFKQTETMFKFTTGKNVKIDPSDNLDKKTVIFGIRPCDAKSYNILDPVFKNDFEDPYYINKRKNSVLIGLSCNKPGVNCFCTSFNESPASAEHVDILFTDINDKYYVDVNSDKGKQLIKNMSEFFTNPSEKDKQKRKEVEKKAIDDITRQINIDKIEDKLDNIFDSEYWKKIARRCIGCGICTYLCPTCHCFDIQDEASATRGARVRVWDTCMRSEYTLHASGFNPRPMRMNRVRNRIYHKYNYFPKNFGMIACVGCGRCTENCPVNIDIIDVINKSREVVCP